MEFPYRKILIGRVVVKIDSGVTDKYVFIEGGGAELLSPVMDKPVLAGKF
jgi:hypothetical protein